MQHNSGNIDSHALPDVYNALRRHRGHHTYISDTAFLRYYSLRITYNLNYRLDFIELKTNITYVKQKRPKQEKFLKTQDVNHRSLDI